nr:hypothetical protein [Lachnospiraceae bacterium]
YVRTLRLDGRDLDPKRELMEMEDGTLTYEWTVSEACDHRNIEIELDQEHMGDGEEARPDDFDGFISDISGEKFAYCFHDRDSLKQSVAKQIWGKFAGRGRPYYGMFESFDDLCNSIEMSDTESNENSMFVLKDGSTGSYYSFRVKLNRNDDGEKEVSNNVYLLDKDTEFVVILYKGEDYSIIVADTEDADENGDVNITGDYDLFGSDERMTPGIDVFGNGIDIDGNLGLTDPFYTQYHFALHCTSWHTDDAGFVPMNVRLMVYNSDYSGVNIDGNHELGSAAQWGFNFEPAVALNSSSKEEPAEVDMYLGDTKILVSSNLGKGAAKEIEKVECLLENADKAVNITYDDQKQIFVVKRLSNFYDSIPLKITYKDSDKAEYVTVNIVGLAICDTSRHGDENMQGSIWHGTDHQTFFDWEGDDRWAICCSFYYPSDKDPRITDGKRVSVYATYTWKDGNVTRKLISDTINEQLVTDANQGTNPLDDFLLWSGDDESKMPVKVEVIALYESEDTETFGGALLGSGAGVCFTR